MDASLVVNIGIFLLLAIFIYTRFVPVKGLQTLSEDEFRNAFQRNHDALLIDVREPYEFQGGSIAKAKNIPLSQLSGRLHEIPKDREVYLFCRSGMRSKNAAKLLSRQGHQKLSHLRGGIMAWRGKLTKL